MLEDEVVRRRQWLTREEFLDYLGATNLIPGPNSTELAMHVGRTRAGWPGLIVAGACFILPAALIVGALGWTYVHYGSLPALQGVLYGVKPVVIAVVLQALRGLGATALKSRTLAALGAFCVLAAAFGVNELLILGAAAAAMLVGRGFVRRGVACSAGIAGGAAVASASPVSAAALLGATPFSLGLLFGTFVKIGAVLFGSGYVLLAFLRADFVSNLGWLTEQQLLDAIAVGQMTPGPVFTTATFVGYLLGGTAGAAVATVGIFLPAFIFVALSSTLVPRLRASPVARAALDGVNVASLALMAVVSWHLGLASLVDASTVAIFAVSLFLLVRYRINASWLVLGGALLGIQVLPR
jgi:chromate transporter